MVCPSVGIMEQEVDLSGGTRAYPEPRLLTERTQGLISWARATQRDATSPFEAARTIVRRLGVHRRDRYAEVGFWAPELVERDLPTDQVFLELLSPLDRIDLQADHQKVRFRRWDVPLKQEGEFLWGAVAGMEPGQRDQMGTLYQVRYADGDGRWHVIRDYLAYSVPFGSFAPAEFYDMDRMEWERGDRDYFSHLDTEPEPDGVGRVRAPTNILQVHVGTGSAEGTLAGLTRIYAGIAEKIRRGEPLTPAEEVYVGYDAVQLMPIAPIIEHESGPPLWQRLPHKPAADTAVVCLRRPDMTNWGYDVLLFAMSAINPVVLGSRRPDELVDFIAELHTFPEKPIKVIFDVVYGHIDNQGLDLLNGRFFGGPGMYGQNVSFRNPVVRALLLEMQRRKHNYGVDGVRVDGAQDFKVWDAEAGRMSHDDDYLRLMNDVVQEVAGQRYRPWMIFEDGRPWPRDDWELASTYREVIEQMPNVFQWGPLTFAHNTPFLFTFWISKWWRIREMAEFGSRWISGCANHDTLRRGTQVKTNARVNSYLGDSLPDIFREAYDSPASQLLHYGFLPGVPMDFINASMRAPWGFIRNTDNRYSVKVVSEESGFLDWIVDDALFARQDSFRRLKELGFVELDQLGRFMRVLEHAVRATDYDLGGVVSVLEAVKPPLAVRPFSAYELKRIARAWMDDVHELCNVARYGEGLTAKQAHCNLAVREFRRARPWLMKDLGARDHFDYLHPVDGSVVFHGLRHGPKGHEQILFLANMTGATCTIVPTGLPIPHVETDGWELAVAAPGLEVASADQPIQLHDGQGAVFVRRNRSEPPSTGSL